MHSTIHAVCGQQKGQNRAKSHVRLILKKKKKKKKKVSRYLGRDTIHVSPAQVSRCIDASMHRYDPSDKSVFAGGRRVNLNLFAACICYIVATCFLEQHREGALLQGILFQICYEYKVRRLNNILIIGNPRDTDIRQCIHNQTNLIYCVNNIRPYRIGLIMHCYLFLSACKMAWIWAKFKIRNPVTVTP